MHVLWSRLFDTSEKGALAYDGFSMKVATPPRARRSLERLTRVT